MSGVFPFVWGTVWGSAGGHVFRKGRPVRLNCAREISRMVLAGQEIDWHWKESRICREFRAVAKRASHGFDHVMELLRRPLHSQLRRKVLEDVQHLNQSAAA